jgi:hypothetical protein
MMKTYRSTILPGVLVSVLILITTGCLDLFVIQSKTEIIPKRKGVYAKGFKPGMYKDDGKSPEENLITWIKKDKEYEIVQRKNSKRARFRLKKLKGKYFLMQTREKQDGPFQYFIITIDNGVIGFPDIKEEAKDKVTGLMEQYRLARDEDELVSAGRKTLLAFLKAVIKRKYLEPGHYIRRVEKKQ